MKKPDGMLGPEKLNSESTPRQAQLNNTQNKSNVNGNITASINVDRTGSY